MIPAFARGACRALLVCLPLAGWASDRGPAGATDLVDYRRDIRPILSNACYYCHGPDEQQRQAGLRLDTRDSALGELESGVRAVVPGQRRQSAVYQRITARHADERMPPEGHEPLSPEQVELIGRWIDQQAPWQEHWSFVAPQRPAVPAAVDGQASDNPIDRFVDARLAPEGLRRSPEADAQTLVRRVTLDLTGLPPTLDQIDAYLADRDPGAYERLVDRLLASPRYGEHMARYWLDAARYGDTHGLHLDNERSMWPYREWVIGAFNSNLPFDRFTVEQLAGDLLPEPSREQLVATGFQRCNVSTSEGGSIDAEVAVRYAVDRVETMATVWMGLTLGCTVCHDHKYDPFTQREFYQLFAFYNSLTDKAMDGNALTPPPTLDLPTPQQRLQQHALGQRRDELQAKLEAALAAVDYADPDDADERPEAVEFVWIDDALPEGARATSSGEGAKGWQFVGGPEHPVYCGSAATMRSTRGTGQHYFTGAKQGLKIGADDKLFAYVYLDPRDPPKAVMLQFNDGTWEHRAVWGVDVIPFGRSNTDGRRLIGPLPEPGQWARLEVDAQRVGLTAGTTVTGWAFTQYDGTVYWDKAGSVTLTPPDGRGFRSQRAWERFERQRKDSKLPKPILEIVRKQAPKRSEADERQLRKYFLEYVCAETRDTFEPLHKQMTALDAQRDALARSIPTTLVMQELDEPRETFVLLRGEYDKPGEKVQRGVPAVLPPLAEDQPPNRLGLARWLVDPRHPLTARVTVNRFWQQLFGTGLVKTAEDFGSQGQWPSHPELLDWLAVEFMESGWDVKRLLRLIVTSSTYRQSSRVTPELARRDPENRLLARGPRFRMDAEMVRDGALALSGLLVEKLGGPSVKPYQPPGIWEAVAFLSSNTRVFSRDEGEALYRRSMYTFWKRTAPPPSMTALDAPSRETCTPRRPRTNTPLQALALMNDEQFVEAARHFGGRMIHEGGATAGERLAYGFRLATGRPPNQAERDVLLRVFQRHSEHYQADVPAARQLVSVGASPPDEALEPAEHAAYTMMANLMLNLDETITKQ